MGFNPPVPQQDNDWEIRAAVLLSLFLQILLIFVAPMRKRFSFPVTRFTVWSCYLLADWVADLALGLILNNMGNIGGGGNNNASSPIIFAFWTPFLLLHLGGPDTITAYSLEDNELWPRHLIGLLFELFSACVIFFCSLHGNPLIKATVLVFIVGIIKYGERSYSLYSGSVDGFHDKILDPPDRGSNYAKFMTEFDSKEKAGLVVEVAVPNGEATVAHSEMQKLQETRLVLDVSKSVEARAYEFFLIFRRLFVDLILSFKQQRRSKAAFVEQTTRAEAFAVIEMELNFIYDMVYTKAPVAYKKIGWALRFLCSCCLVSALVIFFFLDKDKPGHRIRRVDVIITYALLLGGLALDVAALLMIFFSDRAKVYLEAPQQLWLLRRLAALRQSAAKWWWEPRRWSGMVAQFNLISYCLGVPDSSSDGIGSNICGCCLMVAKMLGAGRGVADYLPPFVQDLIFIHYQPLRIKYKTEFSSFYIEESQLLDTFFDSIKETAKKLTHGDYLEIEKVFNCRGSLVLNRHKDQIIERQWVTGGHKIFSVIIDSVVKVKDFDESLLLWHIATDLCLRVRVYEGPMLQDASRMQAISKTLSEYMLYLLIKHPEMLSERTGMWLMRYRDTCDEARRCFGFMKLWILDDNDDARRMLLDVNTSEKPSVVKADDSLSVLFDAVILAKALRELYEELMWEILIWLVSGWRC